MFNLDFTMYNRFHPTSPKTDLVKRTFPNSSHFVHQNERPIEIEYSNYLTLVTQPINNPFRSIQGQQYSSCMSTTHQSKHVNIPTFTSNTYNNQYFLSLDTKKVFRQFHTPREDCITSIRPSTYT